MHKYELKARKFLKTLSIEVNSDVKDMFNFLLFYKPHGNLDKTLHIVEVFAFWAILTTLYIRW